MALSKDQIENFVGDIHKALHDSAPDRFSLEPPYSIEFAIEQAGGKIEQVRSMEAEGEVYPDRPYESRRFTIRLPWYTGEMKDRFTLAHELGHIMLHFNWPSKEEWINICETADRLFPGRDYKLTMFRAGRNRLEYEANHFAACFLMPQRDVRSYTAQEFEKGVAVDIEKFITRMADTFRVSRFAMETRLKFLGLLSW
jgi:hypothetical protein